MKRQQRKAVLASIPANVRAAIDARDGAVLKAALDELPPQEAQTIAQKLREI
jgi:hypothetical protein